MEHWEASLDLNASSCSPVPVPTFRWAAVAVVQVLSVVSRFSQTAILSQTARLARTDVAADAAQVAPLWVGTSALEGAFSAAKFCSVG